MSITAELRRRKVFRTAGAYLVGAWIVLQVADTLFPALHMPPWTVTIVAVAAIIGFPKSHEVAIKIHDKAPDARAALNELDSMLVRTVVAPNFREHLTRTSAGYHAALGDFEGAYAIALRTQRDAPYALAPLMLDRARYASRAGKRAEAIAAYTRYLEMRPNPEPGRAAQNVANAREELGALMRDR